MAGLAISACSACRETRSSALICAHVFLVPMLDRLLGVAEAARPEPEAMLGEAIEANGPREHYMRALSEWRRGRHAGRAPAALAGLLPGGGVRPRRLPDRQGGPCAGPAAGRPRQDHRPSIAVKAPETRIAPGRLLRRADRISWYSPLQNTNRTDKMFMICTSGRSIVKASTKAQPLKGTRCSRRSKKSFSCSSMSG